MTLQDPVSPICADVFRGVPGGQSQNSEKRLQERNEYNAYGAAAAAASCQNQHQPPMEVAAVNNRSLSLELHQGAPKDPSKRLPGFMAASIGRPQFQQIEQPPQPQEFQAQSRGMPVCTPSPTARRSSRGRKRTSQCLMPITVPSKESTEAPIGGQLPADTGATSLPAAFGSSHSRAGTHQSPRTQGLRPSSDHGRIGMPMTPRRTPTRNHFSGDRHDAFGAEVGTPQTPTGMHNAFQHLQLQSPANASLRSAGSSFSAFHNNFPSPARPQQGRPRSNSGTTSSSPRVCEVRILQSNHSTEVSTPAGRSRAISSRPPLSSTRGARTPIVSDRNLGLSRAGTNSIFKRSSGALPIPLNISASADAADLSSFQLQPPASGIRSWWTPNALPDETRYAESSMSPPPMFFPPPSPAMSASLPKLKLAPRSPKSTFSLNSPFRGASWNQQPMADQPRFFSKDSPSAPITSGNANSMNINRAMSFEHWSMTPERKYLSNEVRELRYNSPSVPMLEQTSGSSSNSPVPEDIDVNRTPTSVFLRKQHGSGKVQSPHLWNGPFGIKTKSLLTPSRSGGMLREMAEEEQRRKAATVDEDSLTDSDDEDEFVLTTPREMATDRRLVRRWDGDENRHAAPDLVSASMERSSTQSSTQSSAASLVGPAFMNGSLNSMDCDIDASLQPTCYQKGALGRNKALYRSDSSDSLGSVGMPLESSSGEEVRNYPVRDLVTPPPTAPTPETTLDIPPTPLRGALHNASSTVCVSRADPEAVNMAIAQMAHAVHSSKSPAAQRAE